MKTQTSTAPLYPVGIVRSRDVPAVAEPVVLGQVVPVRWIFAEELACAAIDASETPPKPMDHVLALDAIHRRISVLPIRFGTQMTDEEGIGHLLLAQRQELLQCVDRVEGASEMGLRISLPPGPLPKAELPARTSLPTDYLASRRAFYQHEDQLNGQANRTTNHYVRGLDGLYRQWRNLASSLPGVIRLAFLVERDRVELFRDRLKVLRDATRGEPCEVLGPWPPYSFV